VFRVGYSSESAVIEILGLLHDAMDLPRDLPPVDDASWQSESPARILDARAIMPVPQQPASRGAKVRIPYFGTSAMLAKITSKNQLTLPKAVTQAVGPAEYFQVEARAGQIVLTPVRIQRADAVRGKLAELALSEADVADAVAWARGAASVPKVAKAAKAARPAAKRRARA